MIGFAALAITVAAWLDYLRRIPGERVPRKPIAHTVVQGLAVLLAIVALTRGEYALSILTLVLAGFFVWLLTHARMLEGAVTASVGDPMPAFEARTSSGSLFSSQDRAGRRTLYKFFRGHW